MTRTGGKSGSAVKAKTGGVTKRRAQASSDAHEKRPPGRPPTYDQAVIVPIICEQLSTGKPLTQICSAPGMPGDRVVRDWIVKDPDVAAEFAQARARGYDAIADECLAIADMPCAVTAMGSNDAGDVAHRKLRIETRLKLLAKWDPKRYGEKQQVEHSGSIGLEGLIAGVDGAD